MKTGQIAGIAASLCLMGMAVTACSSSDDEATENVTEAVEVSMPACADLEPAILFTQTAGSGSITAAGTQHTVVMNGVDSSLWFSDRPDEGTGIVPATEYVDNWTDYGFGDTALAGVKVQFGDTVYNFPLVVEQPTYDAVAKTLTYTAEVVNEVDETTLPVGEVQAITMMLDTEYGEDVDCDADNAVPVDVVYAQDSQSIAVAPTETEDEYNVTVDGGGQTVWQVTDPDRAAGVLGTSDLVSHVDGSATADGASGTIILNNADGTTTNVDVEISKGSYDVETDTAVYTVSVVDDEIEVDFADEATSGTLFFTTEAINEQITDSVTQQVPVVVGSQKIGQSDVPDNMLSLWSALSDSQNNNLAIQNAVANQQAMNQTTMANLVANLDQIPQRPAFVQDPQ